MSQPQEEKSFTPLPERAMENSPSNKVLKIKTIFGGKHVNFAPDVLHHSVLIRPVALTGQKKFTTPDPRAALEVELTLGWYPLRFQRVNAKV